MDKKREAHSFEAEARDIILTREKLSPEQYNRAYYVAKKLAVLSGEVDRGARYAFLGYQVLNKIGETGDRKLVDMYLENAEKDRSDEGGLIRDKLKRASGKTSRQKYSLGLFFLGLLAEFIGLMGFNLVLTGKAVSDLPAKSNLISALLIVIGIFLLFLSAKKGRL